MVTASAHTIGLTSAALAIVIVIGTSNAIQAARFVIARCTIATQMVFKQNSAGAPNKAAAKNPKCNLRLLDMKQDSCTKRYPSGVCLQECVRARPDYRAGLCHWRGRMGSVYRQRSRRGHSRRCSL